MTDTYTKPLPAIGDENRPFWDGALKGHLCMQKCRACGHIRYPVNIVCTACLSEEADWVPLSGKGTVFSYIVFHQIYNPAFAKDVPYNVALIQLDEGPRMFSNVVGVRNDKVKVGDRVEAVFDRVTEDVAIPRFRPVEA